MTDVRTAPTSFFNCTRPELEARVSPAYRAVQLYEAVYKRGVDDFARITTLPKELREQLALQFDIRLPTIPHSFDAADGTRRHVVAFPDGEMAEAVFIPDGKRITFCISSQVGCALACAFCLTGQLGFARHLTAGEIVSQVVAARNRDIPEPGLRDHFNLVLMGMGEPLHNYARVMKALEILNDPAGLNISMSRVTLSTVGLIPELERLAGERLIPNLAVSLTGATDALRDRLMPINRAYPIADLVRALQRFPTRRGRRITLEYVLLRDVTDSADDARRLASIANAIPAMVNLIPLNESPDLDFRRPAAPAILRFQEILRSRGVRAFIRKSRGDDISAACGQLKKAVSFQPSVIGAASRTARGVEAETEAGPRRA